MKPKHQNIKIWTSTLSKLRLLKGYVEKPIVQIINELVTEALEKAKKENNA